MKINSSFRQAVIIGSFVAALIAVSADEQAAGAKSVMQSRSHMRGNDMTEAEITSFVKRFERAWSSRRDEDFVAIWHAEGNLIYPFASRVIKGDELPLLNAITKANAPDLKWRMIDWTHRRNVVVVEWESSNVYGGTTVTWRGVDKLTLHEGKIAEEVVYADTAPFQAMRRGEKFPALIPFPDR